MLVPFCISQKKYAPNDSPLSAEIADNTCASRESVTMSHPAQILFTTFAVAALINGTLMVLIIQGTISAPEFAMIALPVCYLWAAWSARRFVRSVEEEEKNHTPS